MKESSEGIDFKRQPGALLRHMQKARHAECIFCNAADSLGIDLDWQVRDDRTVQAAFVLDERFQSYEGIVHGGIVSLLLDGVMTNSLFAEGIVAVTGELTIRYVRSVPIGQRLCIAARVTRSRHGFHLVEAELTGEGEVLATARAKFMEP